MPHIVVLLNLKQDVTVEQYEDFLRSSDLPLVRSMESIAAASTLRASSLLRADGKPPYQYIQVIEVSDMARFREEVATEVAQRAAAEFRLLADNPVFILCDRLDWPEPPKPSTPTASET